MDSTTRIFERKFAMYLLLLICREPGRPKSYYMNYDLKFQRTKWLRMCELEEVGLITVDKTPRKDNVRYIYPTDAGRAVGDAILSIYDRIKGPDVDPDDY